MWETETAGYKLAAKWYQIDPSLIKVVGLELRLIFLATVPPFHRDVTKSDF